MIGSPFGENIEAGTVTGYPGSACVCLISVQLGFKHMPRCSPRNLGRPTIAPVKSGGFNINMGLFTPVLIVTHI